MAAPSGAKRPFVECEHIMLENGNKHYTICGMRFETPANYAVRKAIGQGAYGLVCSGRNVELNRPVAIKKIPKAFEDTVDCKRLLREIKILRHFKHDNVLGIVDILPPTSGKSSWKDVVRCRAAGALGDRARATQPQGSKRLRVPHLSAHRRADIHPPAPFLCCAVHCDRADGHRPTLHHPLQAAALGRALQVLPLPGAQRQYLLAARLGSAARQSQLLANHQHKQPVAAATLRGAHQVLPLPGTQRQ